MDGTQHNPPLLAEILRSNSWLLFGPDWINKHLEAMSAGSYENNTASVVAKLLL
jgi:hypothetical protein